MSEICDVEHAHPAVERVVENLPVGVARDFSASAIWSRMVFVGTSQSTIGQSFSTQASRATATAWAARIVLPPPVGKRRQT